MRLKTIYLDNATAARPSEITLGKMLPFLSEDWGAVSAPHKFGQKLQPALKNGYQGLYQLLGADDESTIIFTSGGVEAVNHVLFGVYHDVTRSRGKNHFLTAQTDEAAAILTVGRLEQMGCSGKMVPVDKQGHLTVDAVADALSPRTALLSMSWGNGITGVIQPVHEIIDLCRERGVLVHLDATHVLGKVYFELEDVGADFITFDGAPLHAPRGTGALYIRKGVNLPPLLLGGSHQGGLRAGEVDLAGLTALSHASVELLDSRDLLCTETVRLRNLLEEGVKSAYPEAELLFQDTERLPHISVMAFPGISNEALLYALSEQGLCATMGGGGFQQISRLLEAQGLPDTVSQCALSFALSRSTTEEEIETATQWIVETARRLRNYSEFILEQ